MVDPKIKLVTAEPCLLLLPVMCWWRPQAMAAVHDDLHAPAQSGHRTVAVNSSASLLGTSSPCWGSSLADSPLQNRNPST